ncbi:hypothetical protein [Brevundimonas sp.]|uniref:hypothetical protein n=1 Tax=Brevundimonas sp. TaxID=1871086 RepID=UPI0035B05FE7
MKIVVPLAGPDFELEDGSTKAELVIEGHPLLRRSLDGRPWAVLQQIVPSDYIFVLKDTAVSREFARCTLQSWYPACKTVFVSDYTQGAALSAAAGCSLTGGKDEPLIVDLADIEFQADLDINAQFSRHAELGAIALTFKSDNPAYSYLLEDADGVFLRAAEKRVISDNASAGAYIFRNPGVYFSALAHALAHPEAHIFNDLFYVCPLFNGVAAGGWVVSRENVLDIRDIKIATQSDR